MIETGLPKRSVSHQKTWVPNNRLARFYFSNFGDLVARLDLERFGQLFFSDRFAFSHRDGDGVFPAIHFVAYNVRTETLEDQTDPLGAALASRNASYVGNVRGACFDGFGLFRCSLRSVRC